MALVSSTPCTSSTSVVGVREIPNRRTSSRCCSASTSRWVIPGCRLATSASTTLVVRHGAQNADENCSNVAVDPRPSTNDVPASTPATAGCGSSSTSGRRWVPLNRPSRTARQSPKPTARTTEPSSTHAPVVMSASCKGRQQFDYLPWVHQHLSVCTCSHRLLIDQHRADRDHTSHCFPTTVDHIAQQVRKSGPRRSVEGVGCHGCGCTRSRPIAHHDAAWDAGWDATRVVEHVRYPCPSRTMHAWRPDEHLAVAHQRPAPQR